MARPNPNFISTVLLLCISFAVSASAVNKASDSVLTFLSPLPFSVLTASACTVEVEPKVPVVSVELLAQYLPPAATDPVLVSLGRLSSPPYRVLWDVSGIENQLLTGAKVFAEALMPDGSTHTTELSGIFVVHKPAPVIQYRAIFSRVGGSIGQPIDLTSRRLLSGSVQARAFVSWNSTGITVSLDCTDAHLVNTLPEDVKKLVGLRVAIDAADKRTPYLTKKVWLVTVPVVGGPFRTLVQAGYRSNGSFGVRQEVQPLNWPASAVVNSGSGYTASITLPLSEIFGKERPSAVSCNILATVIDEDGAVRELSWVAMPQNLSPYTYGRIELVRRSSLLLPWLLLGFCAILGFVIGAAVMIVLKRSQSGLKIEPPSENDASVIEELETLIRTSAIDPALTAQSIPDRMAIMRPRLEKIIRRHFGVSVGDILLKARVEMAKERLRSSHAGEGTVAKHCGFASIDEMEKGFRRFVGTTPIKYRDANKVG